MKDEAYQPPEISLEDLKTLVKGTAENLEKKALDLKIQTGKEYKENIKAIESTITPDNYAIEDDVALYSLKWACEVKKNYLKLIKRMLKNVRKGQKFTSSKLEIGDIYLCKVCGHLIFGTPERLCPVCDNPPHFFETLHKAPSKPAKSGKATKEGKQ